MDNPDVIFVLVELPAPVIPVLQVPPFMHFIQLWDECRNPMVLGGSGLRQPDDLDESACLPHKSDVLSQIDDASVVNVLPEDPLDSLVLELRLDPETFDGLLNFIIRHLFSEDFDLPVCMNTLFGPCDSFTAFGDHNLDVDLRRLTVVEDREVPLDVLHELSSFDVHPPPSLQVPDDFTTSV